MRWRLDWRVLTACGVLGLLAWVGLSLGRFPVRHAQQLRVVVDLSASRVEVYRGDERIRSYVASVGMPQYRTPVGEYAITSAVFNPSWTPPNSPWARGKRPEPPGPNNPMGRVKLNFHPAYFIHGTPDTAHLGQPVSHGCVRLSNENAIDLARLVLGAGAPGVSEAEIDAILAHPHETRTIGLSNPVPVRVVG